MLSRHGLGLGLTRGGGTGGAVLPALGAHIHNLKASNTRYIRQSLLDVPAGGRSLILCPGDSTTAGPQALDSSFTNVRPNSWPAKMATALQTAGIPTSFEGFNGFQGRTAVEFFGVAHPNVTSGGGWTPGGNTLGGASFTNTTTTDVLSLSTASAVDRRFRLFYYREISATYGFEWNIDGGAWTAVNQTEAGTGTLASIGVLELTSAVAGAEALATPGVHILNLRKQAGKSAIINQCIAWDGAVPAVDIINGGWSSSKSSDWAAGSSNTKPAAGITYYQPNLTIPNEGINDWRTAPVTAQFTTDYSAQIERALKFGDVILVIPFPTDPLDTSIAQQAGYITAIYAMATTYDLPVIDLTEKFVDWNTAFANGFTRDNVHPSQSAIDSIAADMALMVRHAANFSESYEDADATAIINAYGDLSAAEQRHVKFAVFGYKSIAATWTKRDCIMDFSIATAVAPLKNWKNTALAGTIVGAPVRVANKHYTFDGVDDTIDTQHNPSTFGGQASQNSLNMAIWSKTAPQVTNSAAGWYDGTDGITIATRNTTNAAGFRAGQTTAIGTTDSNGNGVGDISVNRSAAGAVQQYIYGLSATTGSNASTALNNATLKLGSVTAALFAAVSIADFQFGGSLVAAEVAAEHRVRFAFKSSKGYVYQ